MAAVIYNGNENMEKEVARLHLVLALDHAGKRIFFVLFCFSDMFK